MQVAGLEFTEPVPLDWTSYLDGPGIYLFRSRHEYGGIIPFSYWDDLYVGRANDFATRPVTVLHEQFENAFRLAEANGAEDRVYVSYMPMPGSSDFERYLREKHVYEMRRPPLNRLAPARPEISEYLRALKIRYPTLGR